MAFILDRTMSPIAARRTWRCCLASERMTPPTGGSRCTDALSGDLGCGAISVELRVSDEVVEWSDWAYEVNYAIDDTSECVRLLAEDELAAFSFGRGEYVALFQGVLTESIASWGRQHRS
jgi:hypothetical protein